MGEPHLKLHGVLRLRHFVSRRSLSLTSMSLKLLLIMPTRQMLRVKRPSSVIKDSSGILFKAMKNKPVDAKKSWRQLVLLNARQMLLVVRLKSLELFWILLIAPSVNWIVNFLLLAWQMNSELNKIMFRLNLELNGLLTAKLENWNLDPPNLRLLRTSRPSNVLKDVLRNCNFNKR